MKNNLSELRLVWLKRIRNTSGIIYKYVQRELIESFIEDLEKFFR